MTSQSVLYVEDDANDEFFMRRAWTKVQVQNPLQVVTDGQKALDYSRAKGRMPTASIIRCHALCSWI